MKRLTLIRHAKSVQNPEPPVPDFDRPLNERGLGDIPIMGDILRAQPDFRPDRVVSSPAARALATARGIASSISVDPEEIELAGSIYEAPVDAIIEVIRAIPDEVAHVALFGHNPGFQNTANFLLHDESTFVHNLPTLGIVDLRLPIDEWRHADRGIAERIQFLYPKQFK